MPTLSALDFDDVLPVTFTLPGLTESQFMALVQMSPDNFWEYTADGVVIIQPARTVDEGALLQDVVFQLHDWSKTHGDGSVTGPDGGFFFPNGARRSPDAAWFNKPRWQAAQRPGTRFPVFAPEFVIEVRSQNQRIRDLREKMEEYIANGVLLGWLIDPIDHTVMIYRPGREPEVLTDPVSVAGEVPVEGFVLDLGRIF
jgi:Uma2 family endonuclease